MRSRHKRIYFSLPDRLVRAPCDRCRHDISMREGDGRCAEYGLRNVDVRTAMRRTSRSRTRRSMSSSRTACSATARGGPRSHRVLKPGGRVQIADIVIQGEVLPRQRSSRYWPFGPVESPVLCWKQSWSASCATAGFRRYAFSTGSIVFTGTTKERTAKRYACRGSQSDGNALVIALARLEQSQESTSYFTVYSGPTS